MTPTLNCNHIRNLLVGDDARSLSSPIRCRTSKGLRGSPETPHVLRDRKGRQRATLVCLLTLLAVFAPAVLGQSPAGNALHFDGGNDRVQMTAFTDRFPTVQFTVEFWMKTSDTSRSGTPFSYATAAEDDSLYIFN